MARHRLRRSDYEKYSIHHRIRNKISEFILKGTQLTEEELVLLRTGNFGEIFSECDLSILDEHSDLSIEDIRITRSLSEILRAESEKRKLYKLREKLGLASLFPDIDKEIVEYLKQNPNRLRDLSPRQFEEFVAQIFLNQGYDVELTPETRDGGVDIIAVDRSKYIGESVYLIECKRYSKRNSVGLGVVQRMLGVASQKRANKGLIVTTSSFTKGARDVQKETGNILLLHDYRTLESWLHNLRI